MVDIRLYGSYEDLIESGFSEIEIKFNDNVGKFYVDLVRDKILKEEP